MKRKYVVYVDPDDAYRVLKLLRRNGAAVVSVAIKIYVEPHVLGGIKRYYRKVRLVRL